MNADGELLREYTEQGSQHAFEELVRRHVDLVYSCALRTLNGDAHLAEDITQTVFNDVARKATSLKRRTDIAGWLYTSTYFACSKAVRTETRRRQREQEAQAMHDLLHASPEEPAWEQLRPVLDEAMHQLTESDREAVVLRYFKNQPLAEIGGRLGLTENAARMRVERALGRLRNYLSSRGIGISGAALAGLLSAHAVHAAPAALVITASAAAASTAAGAVMSWFNLKSATALLTAAVAAGTGTYFVEQHETTRLRTANEQLLVQQEQMRRERDEIASNAAAASEELDSLRANLGELLRLRNEVAALRQTTNEMARLREDRARLQALSREQSIPEANAEPLEQSPHAKLSDAKLLVMGLILYAKEHGNQLPENLAQASRYIPSKVIYSLKYYDDPELKSRNQTSDSSEASFTGTNEFELVIQGDWSTVRDPGNIIAVRERAAWISPKTGKWSKVYGFADGHAELQSEPPEGFEEWEKQRLVSTVR